MATPTTTPASRPATPDERAAMDAAVSEVRRVYALARVKVEALPVSLAVQSTATAALKNIRDLGPRVDRWADVYRRWATTGLRDDGSAYSVPRFLEFGRELADAANVHAGAALDAQAFTIAARATAATVEQLANPSLWPSWLKWTVAAIGAALIAQAVAPLVRVAKG